MKYKDTYKVYAKLKKSKQEDFYNEHTAELILFESARKYLKENLGESKTLNRSKWKSELAALKKEKKSLYNQILEIREEVEQAEKVKTCIEQLQGQEKQLIKSKSQDLGLQSIMYNGIISYTNHTKKEIYYVNTKRQICLDSNCWRKGQIVIPKQAREVFNIKLGDTVLLLGDEKRGIAIPPKEAFSHLMKVAYSDEGDE